MKTVREIIEFEWDKGNIEKNWTKHSITDKEAEEIFFDNKRFIFKDKVHSQKEERFRILGKTDSKKLLFIVFTKRGKKIRIISARKTNRKEALIYEKKINTTKV